MPPDPVRWSCQYFGSLWQAFMLIWMIWSKNDLKVSYMKQVNAPSNMNLVKYLMNFEYQPCGILEVFSYHQEDEAIAPTIFVATVGLKDIIKKLVLSNFMGMFSSVSVIFDTGDTYSCSPKKYTLWSLKRRCSQEISKTYQKALIFLDLVLLNILSGVKVEILLHSHLRHIMFMGYQRICI